MAVKVKICGITNSDDAAHAVEAGADVLGFVFCQESPRHVSIQDAAAICRQVPPHILRAGVFMNPAEDLVTEAIGDCGLNLVQFHGDEPPQFCLQFGIPSMKAFRVRDAGTIEKLQLYPTDAWLLDAYSSSALGGTGETFNWELARQAQRMGRPIFLAGGLTPLNVEAAIQQVRPFGVDVSSGVEERPGRKDAARMRAFVAAARRAGSEPS